MKKNGLFTIPLWLGFDTGSNSTRFIPTKRKWNVLCVTVDLTGRSNGIMTYFEFQSHYYFQMT